MTDSASAKATFSNAATLTVNAAPTAAVDNVTISGTKGTAITAKDVIINLTNEKFKAMTTTGVTNLADWFTNAPAGLTFALKEDVAQDATSATITVSGTPTAAKSEAMAITIPAASLAGNAPLTITVNADAKWAIAADPNVPTITLGAQTGTLTAGTAGNVTYGLTINYTKGNEFSAIWYTDNAGATTCNGPAGVTLSVPGSNACYGSSTAATPAGTYYFKLSNEVNWNGTAETIFSNLQTLIVGGPSTPTVTSVAVNPATVSVAKGGTQNFIATVTGTNNPAQTVTWTVTGGTVGTSIDTSGKLTVAAGETATALTVTATSTVDTTKSCAAVVTVTTPVLTITASGCTSFQVGCASGNAVFTVRSSDNSLNATNYGSATLNGQPLSLSTVGMLGADGSVADGSLVVTINKTKLNTLKVGNHTLAIALQSGAFEGKIVTGVITVTSAFVVPKTGDDTPLTTLVLLALLACSGISLLLTYKRPAKR